VTGESGASVVVLMELMVLSSLLYVIKRVMIHSSTIFLDSFYDGSVDVTVMTPCNTVKELNQSLTKTTKS
jgi:hypothetical protein